jgi:tripartite-type tricarboxylate transporter receptor subunit TctC
MSSTFMSKNAWNAFAALCIGLACAAASAQPFPSRPVRIVLPVPPGGLQDALTRALAQELSGAWNQAVIAENRPGAGGVTAAEAVARAAPDGHTVLMADGVPLTITPFLNSRLPYDAVKDFAPVVGLAQSSSVVIASPNAPFNSMTELLARARARPGDVSYGSFGVGAANHLSTERLAMLTGVRLLHVPYKGGVDVMRAIMAGELDFSLTGLTAALPLIKQGRIKVIGYAGAQRLAALPDVPAVFESVPGFSQVSFFGWWVPTGTPRAIVDRIASEVQRVLAAPQFSEKNITGVGLEPLGIGPDKFGELVRSERVNNEEVVKRLKLKLD